MKGSKMLTNAIELFLIDPTLFTGESGQAVATTFIGGLGILVAGLMSSTALPTLLLMSSM